MKRMEKSPAESRAPSLGRSRSRGRSNPSELLARRQQLVSEESGWLSAENRSNDVDSSVSSTGEGAASDADSVHHSRSLARRARQSEATLLTSRRADSSNINHRFEQSSVEAKLESLSELLKSHQNDTSMMMLSKTDSTSTTTATTMNTLLNNTNNNSLHNSDEQQQQQTPSTPNTAKSIDDVYILLAKKEKDLQLAAELGKVLLEKNDELSKANERITEDYSHKLEVSLVKIVLLYERCVLVSKDE